MAIGLPQNRSMKSSNMTNFIEVRKIMRTFDILATAMNNS